MGNHLRVSSRSELAGGNSRLVGIEFRVVQYKGTASENRNEEKHSHARDIFQNYISNHQMIRFGLKIPLSCLSAT